MLFHPHVHMLVTAGGLAPDDQTWVSPKHPNFLVPDRALSIIFRAKFCAGLKKADCSRIVPIPVWKKNWVVHSQHAGRGDKVLDYLATLRLPDRHLQQPAGIHRQRHSPISLPRQSL